VHEFRELKRAAFHEAGHVVMGYLKGFPVTRVNVDELGRGETNIAWWYRTFVLPRGDYELQVAHLEFVFGGYAAERMMASEEEAKSGSIFDFRFAYAVSREWVGLRSEIPVICDRVCLLMPRYEPWLVRVSSALMSSNILKKRQLYKLLNDLPRT
jgi:hypothetical protein